MKVQFVVVDSGPIIKGADLNKFSEHAVIVPGVIREIKDVKTRERIRNLPPYFLSIQIPSEKSIKHVKSVASKSGDIKVLSTIDIEVLAMAYELKFTKTREQIELMFENLNLDDKITTNGNTDNSFFDFTDDKSEDIILTDTEDSDDKGEEHSDDQGEEHSDEEEEGSNSDVESVQLEIVEDVEEDEVVTASTMPLTDNDGWITAENFDEMKKNNFGFEKMDDVVAIEDAEEIPIVGCLTTDYAMQNVLLHMGVTILSVDGMIIKEPRIFVSYCRACFHKYRRVDLYFCPHCGNDNIGKVPAKISANGEMELFLKKNFQPNLRNKIFSIPTPKGGKHIDGTHYIYCADQRVPDERLKKNRCVIDLNDDGPLPFVMHDFKSRSSVMGLSTSQHKLRPSVPRGNKHHRRRK